MAKKWVKKLKWIISQAHFSSGNSWFSKGNLLYIRYQGICKSALEGLKLVIIWGKAWDIEKDGINWHINEKSQFKFFKKFNSFQDWLESFNECYLWVSEGHLT
jgi:hypothetical protein